MTNSFRTCFRLAIIAIAAIAALLMSSVILWIIGADPIRTFHTICILPLTNMLHITEVLIRAIPLCIIALGISVGYRSGIINIGAEGQMAIGILSFTGVALAFPDVPRPILLPIALLASVIGGGIWGFIPGILKAKLKVSELLSTVMLNYIAAQLYSLCLRTIYLDPAEQVYGTGTPQSMRLTENVWLGRIGTGVRLHYGLIIAFVLAALIFFLMWKTTIGFRMRAAGSSDRASRYAGINVPMYITVAIVISGAFSGLAGGIEIAGVHRRAIEGVTNNYGFSGIVVALFGGLHPFGIIPASFLFGLLIYGATLAPSIVGVPANIVQVMQGIIIIVIVTAQMVLSNTYFQDRVWRKISQRKGKEAANA